MKSKFGKLTLKDILKGLITAVLSSIAIGVQQSLTTGDALNGHTVLMTGAAAGVGYVVKNLLTNSDDEFGKFENKPTE